MLVPTGDPVASNPLAVLASLLAAKLELAAILAVSAHAVMFSCSSMVSSAAMDEFSEVLAAEEGIQRSTTVSAPSVCSPV